jgi:hypothetical protein
MRKLLFFLLLLVVVGCSGGGGDAAPSTTTTTSFDDLPPALAAVLEGVRPPGRVAFDGTYRVLKKLGGLTSTVRVVVAPPDVRIVADGAEVDGEAELASYGVSSRFFADGPARMIATDARRTNAGEAIVSERTVAGVGLRCVGVPFNGAVATTACFTAEGIAGWFDSAAVRYELTSYRPGEPEPEPPRGVDSRP